MSQEFTGKVALITGATSGIGKAAALAFAEKGANVVITGRREDKGREVVDMITQKGVDARFFRCDAAIAEDCKSMVENTLEQFGRLDFAFNNAGIEGAIGPIIEQTDENFHKVMNINVLGVMNSMKYEIPAMMKNGGGSIVNTASVASMIGMQGMSVYCASKHAVAGLTKCAAVEFGQHGIRVNAISPAAIRTEMYDRFTGGNAEAEEQFKALHPVGRVGESHEIANPVTFLCSQAASFITGTNLPVDGAFTAV
ncbi:MAG: SDR family oxidoreductase [Pseudomonadota bacterium]